MQTVSEYLAQRLSDAGIKDVFGLPGDYNFEILDAVDENPNLKWKGCCNELNAAYAADGYARLNGIGACVTAYGVGELSAINGIAGCYAQDVPVIKIVGAPSTQDMFNHVIVHHSLGDGRWDMYLKAYEQVTDYAVMVTVENAFSAINTAIDTALKEKKPVYIAIPKNIAKAPIVKTVISESPKGIQSKCAAEEILDILKNAKKPILMFDRFVYVHNLKEKAECLARKLGIPVITTEMGKGTINESSPYFCGVFAGSLINPDTCKFFTESDCILALGLVWADFNAGHFTVPLDRNKLINIKNDSVETYENIFDIPSGEKFIDELIEKADSLSYDFQKPEIGLTVPEVKDETPVKCENFFPFLQDFFKENDIVVTDTGLSNLGVIPLRIPDNVHMVNQFLYSSIGWALPAAFGVLSAGSDRRVILISGDGSAQLTIQELSSIYRHNFKPIIFILNNNGYTIERVLSGTPDDLYNNIADWNWELIPQSFCGDSYFKRVCTVADLKEAFCEAEKLQKPAFIEIMLEKMDLPVYAQKVYELAKEKMNKTSEI